MKMERKIFLMVIIILICSINSCKKNKTKDLGHSYVLPSPRVSLNWANTYYGIVPCKDCYGIGVEITLNTNLSYTMRRTYLEDSAAINSPPVPMSDSGTFVWNKQGTEISLNNIKEKIDFQHFIVQEDKLILLNTGNRLNPESNIRDYTLFKVNADTSKLLDKQWDLVEIMGKPVVSSGIHRNRAFIYFKPDGNVYGNLGCNAFYGTYTLQNGSRIQFSNLTNTSKMCHNMQTEEIFKQILIVADNYFLEDNELILNRARINQLARFEAEEQK
jgi:heat shock protein HslJ